MNLENWFPTPIFFSIADEKIKNAIFGEYQSIEEKILQYKNINNVTWGDNIDTTFKYGEDNNIILTQNLFLLKEYIQQVAKTFSHCLFTNPEPILIKESWINYSKKYQHQNKHDHFEENTLSGVYYLKTSGSDGNIKFYPPSACMRYDKKITTEVTHSSIEYKPQEGKIILFPSWVEHSVLPNMTESTRISVSFNLSV
jgi:uncharacterized protein (TIGR02466 family)